MVKYQRLKVESQPRSSTPTTERVARLQFIRHIEGPLDLSAYVWSVNVSGLLPIDINQSSVGINKHVKSEESNAFCVCWSLNIRYTNFRRRTIRMAIAGLQHEPTVCFIWIYGLGYSLCKEKGTRSKDLSQSNTYRLVCGYKAFTLCMQQQFVAE